MIAVTGATGQLGRLVINALLKKYLLVKLLPQSAALRKPVIWQH